MHLRMAAYRLLCRQQRGAALKIYDNQATKYLDSIKGSDETPQSGNNPKKKKAKKNALVLCHDGGQFWTTQKQFWQWAREKTIEKVGDNPLTGKFLEPNEEKDIILANTVLNISRPLHLREVMAQRKLKKKK